MNLKYTLILIKNTMNVVVVALLNNYRLKYKENIEGLDYLSI